MSEPTEPGRQPELPPEASDSIGEQTRVEIRTLPDALEAIAEVHKAFPGQPWWRGQGVAEPLIPSVYRDTSRGSSYEANIAMKFAQRAPTRHANCPARCDLPAWLFLMQHYRLPTRLLDWSEGPLIALFFAVEQEKHVKENGVLWALDPYAMNSMLHGEPGILQPGHRAAHELIHAYSQEGPATEDKVAAVITEEIDLRMMVQLSGLTVHGSPKPLEAYDHSSGFLTGYVIPAEAKPNLLVDLKRLGVRSRNLFPDLEHLGADLKDDQYRG